jgi:hypothetical protein
MPEQYQGSDIVVRGRSLEELLGGLENRQTQVLRREGGRSLKTSLRALQPEFLILLLSFDDPARH